MKKRILILGATGTVGTAIYRQLSQEKDWEIWGTYCSSKQKDSSMLRFSVEMPDKIHSAKINFDIIDIKGKDDLFNDMIVDVNFQEQK